METIHLTVEMIIELLSGPALDPEHVAAWLVADQQAFGTELNRITFVVCPTHPDPDQCDCVDGTGALYRAQMDTVLAEVTP